MPSMFSKPAALLGVVFLANTLGIPAVPPLQLPEFPWEPCGVNSWCTDMYFCAGIWPNLTTAPIPPTATAGFAYAYRTNFSECIPGASPIMRVQPGQRYIVTFHNAADMDPRFINPNSTLGMVMTTAWDPTQDPMVTTTGVTAWGSLDLPLHTTNLHIHGAHISGMGDHDYVLRPVLPGMCQTYIYDVGPDTPGGMHLYHPHAHGRVAYQFLGGAFGPWIVDDFNSAFQSNGIGTDIKRNRPVDQAVKNFLSFRDLERVLNAYAEFGTRMGNGDPLGAAMTITANQWFRFRILHAKAEGILGWTVFKDPLNMVLAWNTTTGPLCEVYELANDGVYLSVVPYLPYAPNGATSQYQYWVHGAQRLELAVRCITVGSFSIEYMGAPVARVTVLPTPVPNPYPSTVASPFTNKGANQWRPNRPNWLADLRGPLFPGWPQEVTTIVPQSLQISFYGINGILFQNAVGPIYSAEYNSSIIYEMNFLNTGVHPTHMHLQHLQIVQPGGCGGLKEGEFYDTATTFGPGSCLTRTRWINFSGLVIMHCHVLDHEDMGILGYIWVPFKAPGSYEASPSFSAITKPGLCCTPRVDATGAQICRGVPQCGGTVGVNTCNQPCTVPVNLCPAITPYCSTTGQCFATIRSLNGEPVADGTTSCTAPIYPFVLMGVGLAVAAVAVVTSVCVLRSRSPNYSTILIEEIKKESMHMPSSKCSPFPTHQSPEP